MNWQERLFVPVYWILFWGCFFPLIGLAAFGGLLYLCGTLIRFYPLEVFGIRIALAVDQLGNVLAGGFPDETISARTGRAYMSEQNHCWTATIIYHFLTWVGLKFAGQEDHSVESIEWDEEFDCRYEPWPWSKFTKEQLAAKRKRGR